MGLNIFPTISHFYCRVMRELRNYPNYYIPNASLRTAEPSLNTVELAPWKLYEVSVTVHWKM